MSLKIAALLLLVAAPVSAQTAKAKTIPGAADKKICRREESTGSIMPGKRTCHTLAEWRQIDEANEKANDAFRNGRPNTGTGSIN